MGGGGVLKVGIMILQVPSKLNNSFYGSMPCFYLLFPKAYGPGFLSHYQTSWLWEYKTFWQGALSKITHDNEYIFTDRPSLCYTNQKVTGFSKSGDQATDTLAI